MRSKKRISACGKAFWTSGSASTAPEQEDVPVLAREQQPRPGGAALGVVGPLHLVEHEHLAAERRHLGRAADDRCALVDALLAGDEADALGAELRREAAVRLLGEHPQRRREDAAAGLGEELERGMRLARVRRADVGDDRLRLRPPEREDDLRARGRGGAPRGAPGAGRGSAASGGRGAPGGRPRALLDLQEAAQRDARADGADGEADEDDDQRDRRERPGLDPGSRRRTRSVIRSEHDRLADQEQEHRRERARARRRSAPRA